jgi:outer membrane biosynthesis protein TonB
MLRIYTSRRQDRRWVTVVASCLGVYLVLAVGYHWFLQPTVVKNSEAAASRLPPATFVVPDRRLAEPATPGQPLRGVTQRSAKQPPAPAGEPATAETAEQPSVAAPKKGQKKKVVRRAHGDFAATYPMYSGSRPF